MWKKGTSLEEEVTRDDFDATVFIDRVFTRTSGEMRESGLDVEKLKSNFELIINNLQILRSQVNNRAALLQLKCKQSDHSFKSELRAVQQQATRADEQFQQLDSRVRQVSDKVYIGEQLERKSAPRCQLQDAKEVIFEFYKYISGTVNLNLSSEDDEEVLLKAAEKIQRLSNLCLELPDDESFLPAKSRVTMAHEEIDQHLTNRFKIEMARANTEAMRRIVNSLSFSKKFSSFITTFVEQCVNKISIHQDLIGNLVPICTEYNTMIESVFANHNAVTLQLIQSIFAGPLKKNIETRIPSPSGDLEQYLINLYSHFVKLDQVMKQLSSSSENLVHDSTALAKLAKELFRPHLVNYIQWELRWLRDRLNTHLSRYYESVNHQRKPISEGGLADVYRDLQARFIPSSGLTNDEREVMTSKMLLSQEVAVNVLEDVKLSLKRSKSLSEPTVLSEDIMTIMDTLVEFLITNHLNYGIYVALQGMLYTDSKREPNLLFFQVVHEANNIFQFLDKVISDALLPLITNPGIHATCVSKRQQILLDLETKLNQGLEKWTMNAIGYVHHILSTEQKKTDFRPDNNDKNVIHTTSQAAVKVVTFLRLLPPQIETYLDGQNREVFCQQFGLQLHRTVMDHLYSYSYNCEGGYVAMQDVNLYDEVMRRFRCPLLNQLFCVLLTLVNVVSMKPENLGSIVRSHLDSGIPRELLVNFVNLRVDHKSVRALCDLR